ncbi:MAG TPA: hypothetical protein VK178_01475 [Opitutaceae bacterium]|nr:hypothetical protein [Opitutaceae bacterium]
MKSERLLSRERGTHKATLRHTPGLAVVLAVMALLALVAPLMGGAYLSTSAITALAAVLTWRFRAMRVIFTESTLIHQGWLRRHEIELGAIERISRPGSNRWPYDRLYGPTVFEIATRNGRVRINLLWFGPGCAQEFRDRLLPSKKRQSR